MNCVETTGKTIDDAIKAGLSQLDKTIDDVTVDVLEEPSRGFLGIGSKPAKVRLTVKEEPVVEPAPPAAAEEAAPVEEAQAGEAEPEGTLPEKTAEKAKDFLQGVMENMGLQVIIEKMIKKDKIILHLHGKNLGLLIGKHGQTLDALQYLTNLTANRGEETRHFVMLDVENYRKRREETLRQLAVRLSGRIKCSGDKVVLEPMNGYERKIIHLALQDKEHVRTESEGQDPYRHVVIYYN
jgi:spoIIIJ-associated protein